MRRNKNIDKKLIIEYVDISLLKPTECNPRTWSRLQEDKLTESINRYGVVDPLIVNAAPERQNIIIGGHFRWYVAKKLGMKSIPVIYLNIPDINKEREINLRLNRDIGEWDWDLLKSFDIELLLDIGFDETDLASIWDSNLGVDDDDFNITKEMESIKEIETKPGDIYKLGNHIVGCGDALDFNFLDKLIDSSKVDMVFTDPPYNINLNYFGIRGKYGGHTKDNKSEDDYKDFLSRAIENALRKVKKDCHIFFFCDESNIGLIQQLYKEHKISNKRVCLWIKNNANPTPQIAFNKMYEACVYGTIGSPYLAPSITNLNEVLNKEVSTAALKNDFFNFSTKFGNY